MEVKYIDLASQYKNNKEVKSEINDILSSTQFIHGSALEKFEKNFANLCGTKYAIGVSSGTDALFLSLKILGIGKGDEVITAPNSFLATVGAISITGAFPRMVDVQDDYNIDPIKIEKSINKKTKAIIPVHLTGNPAAMIEINKIAKKYNLFVIEDACQAINASINNKKVGSFGDLAAFSLHPLKNLNTCGDGGVITTNSKKYYDQLLLYRNHGLINRNESKIFAYNCRLDTIKAAVANLQIKNIDSVTNKRIENARIYDSGLESLNNFIKIPKRKINVKQVFHTYIIQAEKRNLLIEFLNKNGIETKIHYPIPIHLMEAAKVYGYKEGDFPISELQAKKILSLPVHAFLTKEQIYYVINNISKFYNKIN
jgi:dTDP-4-amino-4,6-dideoxygalactose transaminase